MNDPVSLRTILLLVGLLAGLAGCASRPYYADLPEPDARAPVPRRSAPPGVNSYAVRSGDSLHSIAFAAGTDWQTLAALNRIGAPYTIYPGQLLKLSASSVPVTLGMDPDGPATRRRRRGPVRLRRSRLRPRRLQPRPQRRRWSLPRRARCRHRRPTPVHGDGRAAAS